ncbi:hypothetical protein WJX74_004463 [Apatococcus lobatus]|uniref:Rhodanese domain-containing protein n=1 Tax=Apatococcus lobatus TaxID=904363 RepID=A0AAW1SA77_9CHLO
MLQSLTFKSISSLTLRPDGKDLAAPSCSLLGFDKSVSAIRGFETTPALSHPLRLCSRSCHGISHVQRHHSLPLSTLLVAGPTSRMNATSTAASLSFDLKHTENLLSSFRVVNFYHLVDVDDPEQVVREHQQQLQGKDVCGRIYISAQGINAQLSGPAKDAETYAAWVEMQTLFQGLKWTSAPANGHQFPRLRLRTKKNLVQLSGGTLRLPITSAEARATPLQPQEWREMLRAAVPARSPSGGALRSADQCVGMHHSSSNRPQQPWQEVQAAELASQKSSSLSIAASLDDLNCSPGQVAEDSTVNSSRNSSGDNHPIARSASRPIVLDVRNGYEWDAGHFEGAARPQEDQFNQTPAQEEDGAGALPAHLEGVPKDTPIMMYCTGGIRCDIYSTHLRQQGFEQLYTLEGGVQRYLNQLGSDNWDGSLFVFDGRLAIPPGDAARGSLPAAQGCALCGSPAQLPHLNCSNVDCNRLFLACPSCQVEMQGCCCSACKASPRTLRPPKETGHYSTYSTYLGYGESGGGGMPFRTEHARQRRLEKRNAQRQKLRQRFAAVAAKQLAKKQLAREAMEQRMVKATPQMQESQNLDDERYARLKELRQKLASSRASKGASLHV